MEEICRQSTYCVRSGIVSSQTFVVPVVADFPTTYLLSKTLVDSARQWKPVEDSRRDLPTLYVAWRTVVDSGSGRQRTTVKDSGEHWKTVEDSEGQ